MAMYVTGDTHGDIDIGKITSKYFPQGKTLTKSDYLVICGDAGIVWDGDKFDRYIQDFWNSKPWTTLYVDGNHENHFILNHTPSEIWNGGKVHRISDNIFHLCRGQIFNIDGHRIFTMGGARSIDRCFRIEGKTWWPEELPSNREYDEALDNLEKVGYDVDYVFTHCAPTGAQLLIEDYFEKDHLTQFFDSIVGDLNYKYWFCGHYHVDDVVKYPVKDNIKKICALYNEVKRIY